MFSSCRQRVKLAGEMKENDIFHFSFIFMKKLEKIVDKRFLHGYNLSIDSMKRTSKQKVWT